MNKYEILEQLQALQKIVSESLDERPAAAPLSNEDKYVTPHQVEELEYELGNDIELCLSIFKRLGIVRLSDMERSKYRSTINEIRRIKMIRVGECICKSSGVVAQPD
jgi:hypothetical protein